MVDLGVRRPGVPGAPRRLQGRRSRSTSRSANSCAATACRTRAARASGRSDRARRGDRLLGAVCSAACCSAWAKRSSCCVGASGSRDYSVLAYGGAIVRPRVRRWPGSGSALALALSGRLMQRAARARAARLRPDGARCSRARGAFAIGAFRVRRDVFDEELVWKSGAGPARARRLRAGRRCCSTSRSRRCARLVVARRPFSRAAARVELAAAARAADRGDLALAGHARRGGAPDAALGAAASRPRRAEAGNVLFIVVDTLRADHLPLWGYAQRQDAEPRRVRAATRCASSTRSPTRRWTRPSFASLMTGRYPGSHQTMRKSDSLPDEIVTLAEAMQGAGYTTFGVVTNYNVAPFFNFHQGFDEYRYLEPDFVLGANDTAAKLLFVQLLRQRIETLPRQAAARSSRAAPIRTPTHVNPQLLALPRSAARARRCYVFAAYMDPHDPYYPHPYDGTGYARAAHQKPDPNEAPLLRKLYDGEITFWDEHFGKLVAELKRRGLYDDTDDRDHRRPRRGVHRPRRLLARHDALRRAAARAAAAQAAARRARRQRGRALGRERRHHADAAAPQRRRACRTACRAGPVPGGATASSPRRTTRATCCARCACAAARASSS